jgi:hypothetical protein
LRVATVDLPRVDRPSPRARRDRRFTERFFAWMPYLYGELAGAVTELEESALIDAGVIQATGFRYVGDTATSTLYALAKRGNTDA